MQRCITDTETGTVRWEEQGVDDKEFAQELAVLSTAGLAKAIEFSDKAVASAEEERKKFRCVDDLKEAAANRRRQIIVYPDGKEETEESRELGRQLRRERRMEEKEARIFAKKFKPVPNIFTGRVKFS